MLYKVAMLPLFNVLTFVHAVADWSPRVEPIVGMKQVGGRRCNCCGPSGTRVCYTAPIGPNAHSTGIPVALGPRTGGSGKRRGSNN